MEQIPAVQSFSTQGHSLSIAAITGNVVVVAYHSDANITTPTIADTFTSTWTLRFTMGTTNTWLYVWTATTGSTGSDTITVTASGSTNEKINILTTAHVTELVDASATALNAVAGGNVISFPNITTVHYRDFVLNFAEGALGYAGTSTNAASTTSGILNNFTLGGSGGAVYVQGFLSGDPGTVVSPSLQVTAAPGNVASQGVLALRTTSALTVSTPALPDAVINQTYSFQLGATGGLGTNVWSINSGVLPCGLSLSSGGVISGTPSCSNGNTIVFKVTDTAAATATKSLTLQVANSVNTPVLIQGNNGSGGATLAGVVAGHTLLVGITNSTTFAASLFDTPLITDGCGTTYAQLPGPYVNTIGTAIYTQFFIGVGGSGTCAVATGLTVANVWVREWTNLQPIFDTGVAVNLNSTAGGSPITSGTLTVPTANEMLYSIGIAQTAAATISINSPFTSDFALSSNQISGYATGVAAGSQTSAFTVSGNTSNNSGITLFGLRPTTSGTAPVQSLHPRSQVY